MVDAVLGTSKLNSVEIVGVVRPLKDVPKAVSGIFLSMGMMRCGDSKSVDRLVGQFLTAGGRRTGIGHPE